MQATTDSSKASLIVPRPRMLLAVMAHCVFLESYLLLAPLNFFSVPVFVLCQFFDCCCDNYKWDCAAGAPKSSRLTQSHCSLDVGVRWLRCCFMSKCAELVWDCWLFVLTNVNLSLLPQISRTLVWNMPVLGPSGSNQHISFVKFKARILNAEIRRWFEIITTVVG